MSVRIAWDDKEEADESIRRLREKTTAIYRAWGAWERLSVATMRMILHHRAAADGIWGVLRVTDEPCYRGYDVAKHAFTFEFSRRVPKGTVADGPMLTGDYQLVRAPDGLILSIQIPAWLVEQWGERSPVDTKLPPATVAAIDALGAP